VIDDRHLGGIAKPGRLGWASDVADEEYIASPSTAFLYVTSWHTSAGYTCAYGQTFNKT
jgi:hypothetical protein